MTAGRDRDRPPHEARPLSGRERAVTVGAVLALAWYVTSWAVAGAIEPGYDPANQAISELFDLEASTPARLLISSGLLGSAIGLVAFGRVLDRCLPARSPGRPSLIDFAGPAAVIGSGIATGAILAFPCTAGCPGLGTTWTDTGHGIMATLGYGLLVLAPLLVAARVRPWLPRLTTWSLVLGGSALAVFLVNQFDLVGWGDGMAQRIFNTAADVWYVVAAGWLLRGRHLPADPAAVPGTAADTERSAT